MRYRILILWLLLANALFTSGIGSRAVKQDQDLELKTFVDRTVIGVGEQFVFTVQYTGSDAQSAPRPKLPDISGFARYLGYNTSQSMQIINGRMSVSRSMAYYYVAETEGKHRIPAVALDHNGRSVRSDPIEIQVKKAGSPQASPSQKKRSPSGAGQNPEDSLEDNLFLKVTTNKTNVYIHQPIYISYKIYTRVEVTNYVISELPDLMGFWIEDFEIPPQPTTQEEIIDGKRYLVAEIKKIAVFPTSAGEKTIDPLEIECEVRVRSQRPTQDIFDKFFDDDFFASPFGRRIRTKVASSPVKINVKTLPHEEIPADFNGVVGRFSMNTVLDKNQATANEALSLKVTYKGTGNIKMLPEPQITFPQSFEIYDPKIDQKINRRSDTINGSKEYEYVLIPRRAGEYIIKPFSFSYFDPGLGTYKTILSPEFKIPVSTGTASSSPITGGLSRKNVEYIGKDIRFIKQGSEGFHHIDKYFYRSIWFIVILSAAFLFLTGVIIYHQKINRMVENVAYARSQKAQKMAKKRLSQAHKLMSPSNQAEFYTELSRALLGFVADKLNLPEAGLMTEEIKTKLEKGGISDSLIKEMFECLQECDFQRFAPGGSTRSGMETHYNQAKEAIIKLDKLKLS